MRSHPQRDRRARHARVRRRVPARPDRAHRRIRRPVGALDLQARAGRLRDREGMADAPAQHHDVPGSGRTEVFRHVVDHGSVAFARRGGLDRDPRRIAADGPRQRGRHRETLPRRGFFGMRSAGGRQHQNRNMRAERPRDDFHAGVVGMEPIGNEQAGPRTERGLDVGQADAVGRGVRAQIAVVAPHLGHFAGARPHHRRDRGNHRNRPGRPRPQGRLQHHVGHALEIFPGFVDVVGPVHEQHVGRVVLGQQGIDDPQAVAGRHAADAGIDGRRPGIPVQPDRIGNGHEFRPALRDAVAHAKHRSLRLARRNAPRRPCRRQQRGQKPSFVHDHSLAREGDRSA